MKLALLVLTFFTFNHYSKRLIKGAITGHHFMEKAPVLINLLAFMIASMFGYVFDSFFSNDSVDL